MSGSTGLARWSSQDALEAAGEAQLRPMTGSYSVRNRVRTVKRGKATNTNVTEPTPGTLVISGQIPPEYTKLILKVIVATRKRHLSNIRS